MAVWNQPDIKLFMWRHAIAVRDRVHVGTVSNNFKDCWNLFTTCIHIFSWFSHQMVRPTRTSLCGGPLYNHNTWLRLSWLSKTKSPLFQNRTSFTPTSKPLSWLIDWLIDWIYSDKNTARTYSKYKHVLNNRRKDKKTR